MKNITIGLLTIGILTLFSCNKSDDDTPAQGSISGDVKHHDLVIPGAIVYIKYDAEELPGTDPEDFDDQTTASDTDASFEFTDLAKGSYYLFGVGFDDTCSCEVIGGIPVSLDSNSDKVETTVPVTE